MLTKTVNTVCINPPSMPRHGAIQTSGRHPVDCDCAWVEGQLAAIPDLNGIRQSWRNAYASRRAAQGRQASNTWIREVEKKRYTCRACGQIEFPRLDQNGEQKCAGCGGAA